MVFMPFAYIIANFFEPMTIYDLDIRFVDYPTAIKILALYWISIDILWIGCVLITLLLWPYYLMEMAG